MTQVRNSTQVCCKERLLTIDEETYDFGTTFWLMESWQDDRVQFLPNMTAEERRCINANILSISPHCSFLPLILFCFVLTPTLTCWSGLASGEYATLKNVLT